MNINFIIICLIILVILFFFKNSEKFNIYNFNQPYFIKERKFGYYLLVDSNYNVYWDKSFSNSANLLFDNPLSENTYVPIQKFTDYADNVSYLYIQNETLNFTQYNNSNPMLLYNNNNNTITTVLNNLPEFLIINADGSFKFTTDTTIASKFDIVQFNTQVENP